MSRLEPIYVYSDANALAYFRRTGAIRGDKALYALTPAQVAMLEGAEARPELEVEQAIEDLEVVLSRLMNMPRPRTEAFIREAIGRMSRGEKLLSEQADAEPTQLPEFDALMRDHLSAFHRGDVAAMRAAYIALRNLMSAAPPQAAAQAENNGGKTGHPPGMLQDDSRKLTEWFAGKPDARLRVREAAAAIAAQAEPPQAAQPEAQVTAVLDFIERHAGKDAFWRCYTAEGEEAAGALHRRLEALVGLSQHSPPADTTIEAPKGYALVPLHPTQAMAEVMEEEDWTWQDLLASAEAVTEQQYEEIARHTPAEAQGEREALIDAEIISFAHHAAERIPASNYEGRVLHAVRMALAANERKAK